MKKFKRKVLDMLMSNNSGSSLRQQLLDSAPFRSSLLYTAVPQRAASGTTGTFTRATTSTWQNNDGYLVTGVAGEIGFVGARRVRNLVTKSEDLTSGWAANNAGSVTATTITFTAANNDGWVITGFTPIVGNTYRWSALVSTVSGTKNIRFRAGGAALSADIPITTAPTRVSALFTSVTAGGNYGIYNESAGGAATINCTQMQLEDVTAQTTQEAGEYVSVGVPSDWQGTELVTNGTFDTATTGWTAYNLTGSVATISTDSGRLRVANNAATGRGAAYQMVPTIVGAKYVISCLGYSGNSGAGQWGLRVGTSPGDFSLTAVSGADGVPLSAEFTATSTTTYLTPNNIVATANLYVEFDNISVKPAYYHGSFVDGVKCFPTDLDGNPLPSEYTYDAVSLNGVAGTYVSTPDSVAASITGDIDIRVKAALTNWSSGAIQALVAKRSGTDSEYVFRIAATGELTVFWYSSGVIQGVYSSTAATGIAAGVTKWVRVTRDIGVEVVFYLSDDGETWTRLGDVVAAVGSLAATNTAIALDIGSQAGSNLAAGKIYQAQIYNGINGTLAVDFDASRYAGGTTLTGSTGETWTLQGNAVIHPTNSPMLGYQAEGARTNLCLQSNAFTTTWFPLNTPTVVQGATAPDGTASAWTITDNDTVSEFVAQSVACTAANHTVSVFVGKTVGAQTAYPVIGVNNVTGADKLSYVTVDTSNGIATLWTSTTIPGYSIVGVSACCEDFNSEFWRVSMTYTATLENWYINLVPAGTTNATQSTGTIDATAQGSAVFYGAQVELGSSASTYIPTTTAAVTRAADVLTYSSAGNILGTAGWAYAELSTYWTTVQAGGSQALGTGTVSVGPFLNSATSLSTGVRIFDGTNVADATLTLDMYRTPRKRAARWGSDIAVCADGGVVVTGTFDGSMGSVLYIGCAGDTTQQWNGTIRNVRIGQRALSSSELQAVTS